MIPKPELPFRAHFTRLKMLSIDYDLLESFVKRASILGSFDRLDDCERATGRVIAVRINARRILVGLPTDENVTELFDLLGKK